MIELIQIVLILLCAIVLVVLFFYTAYLSVTRFFYHLVDLAETSSLLLGVSKPWKLSLKLLTLPVDLGGELRKMPYYRQLSPAMQRRFESRVARCMHKLVILGKDGLVVTPEMRMKVCAGLVKLTFGYRKYIIDGYKEVWLYPNHYRSPITGHMHKGETQSRGLVLFSWPDLAAGFENPTDNLHLGLHEWSHALWLALYKNREVDNRLQINHTAWDNLIADTSRIKRWKETGYLRAYAFTNNMELFACTVESFFETPAEMAKIHPELYAALAWTLNQNFVHVELKTPALRAGVRLKPYRL